MDSEAAALELGVKFRADIAGSITGLRFYKYAQNTGTHVGNLWTTSGTRLGTVTFTNETASGWQQATFATPIAITANTTYVASYHTNTGFYAATSPGFTTAVDNGPLHALASGSSGGNGVYRAGTTSALPNLTWNASNYWVDVVFTTTQAADTTPPTVTATTPASGATAVAVASTVTATFSEAMTAATIGPSTMLLRTGSTTVAATVAYNATARTATLTPTAALANATTYTATVVGGASGVKDAAGNALAVDATWSFTTAAGDTTPPTVTATTPASGATAVAIASTVTATFSEAMTAATIGPSTMLLRTGSTTVAATVAYNAAARTVTLTPTAALANATTYTATVVGGASGVKDAAGNALAVDATWSFTTAAGDTTPPTVTATTPASGATEVAIASTVTATFSEAMTAATIGPSTMLLRTGSTTVAATVAYNATARTATLTPTAALANATTYTATVVGGASGVKDAAGNALAVDATWSFTTAAGDTTPPTVTATTPASGATAVAVASTVTATFSEAMTAATIGPSTMLLRTGSTTVAATVAYNAAARTATLTPTAALANATTYTATVVGGASGVKDAAGNALAVDATWSFTTSALTGCPCSLWTLATTPGPMDSEAAALELGVKFRSDVSGFVTGVRFYKYAQNTGTHVGNLWTTGGTRLGTVTFTNETASGWQQATFATPIAITANTTYVASYHTNTGFYAATSPGFTTAVDNGPLHALASGSSGGNGVYRAGTTSVLPDLTWNATNYWVDVVVTTAIGPDTTPPIVSAVTPAVGATGVARTTAVTVTFSEAMNAATINATTILLMNPSSQVIAASVTYDAATLTATLTPAAALAASTSYTVTAVGGGSGVKDVAGNALANDFVWSFTTAALDTTPPVVTVMTPASGATNVSATKVTATFSEPMAALTITTTSMLLRRGSTAVAASVTYDAATRTATLTPSAALASATVYTATVKSGAGGVTDIAGNGLVSDVTWTFTTSTNNYSQVGQWSSVLPWPLVTLNASLLRTGEVLVWDGGTTAGEPITHGGLSARLWNPVTQAFTSVPLGATDLFCSSACALPDGRIFVAGGGDPSNNNFGVPDANIFNPLTRLWSTAPSMANRRWYPTATCLPDGRVLVSSGSQFTDTDWIRVPEIYDPSRNSWTRLTGAQSSLPYYPHVFVLPDGRVLNASTFQQAIASDVLNIATQTRTTVDSTHVYDGGSAVMYLPGKVMKSGTAAINNGSTASAKATTYVLDMTQPLPAWRQTSPMSFARSYHTLTLLPDGTVLVTGGGTTKSSTDVAHAVYDAEIWSPATETWTTLSRMQRPRLYHSTAILLPDGRVLVAGGGRNFRDGMKELNAEIYSPPYLFKGPRPTISSIPSDVAYGSFMFVQTPDASDIVSAVLVRPGSVTHGFNEDQRLVPLVMQQTAGGLTVQGPANANLAPPGYYMLFIVNSSGVPSVASFLSVGP